MVSPFERAFAYAHMEWFTERFAVTTEEGATAVRTAGVALALLSTRYDWPTLPFAALWFHHVFVVITNFVNHNYLFWLLSTLTAVYVHAGGKEGWLHALRWQVAVVYMYSTLWKLHYDWLDGTIVRLIFLSFEEQGVARNVPWRALEQAVPHIFGIVAIVGVCLDAALFLVLVFGRPGAKAQWLVVIFHAFTAITMAQRIGYAFPLCMCAAGMLFERFGRRDRLSLWERGMPRGLPAVWIAVQLLLPLRMPIVSNLEFKATGEAYRFSWTMMLHSKQTLWEGGLGLRAHCGGQSHVVPVTKMVGGRGRAAIDTYPRQIAPFAAAVVDTACGGVGEVYGTVFTSINDGPFVRLVDPTVELVKAHRATRHLAYTTKLWKALVDKPADKEFLLRRAATLSTGRNVGWIRFVDRAACLYADPLRFLDVALELRVLHTPTRLQIRNLDSKGQRALAEGTIVVVKNAELSVAGAPAATSCAEADEDIVFEVRPYKRDASGSVNHG